MNLCWLISIEALFLVLHTNIPKYVIAMIVWSNTYMDTYRAILNFIVPQCYVIKLRCLLNYLNVHLIHSLLNNNFVNFNGNCRSLTKDSFYQFKLFNRSKMKFWSNNFIEAVIIFYLCTHILKTWFSPNVYICNKLLENNNISCKWTIPCNYVSLVSFSAHRANGLLSYCRDVSSVCPLAKRGAKVSPAYWTEVWLKKRGGGAGESAPNVRSLNLID